MVCVQMQARSHRPLPLPMRKHGAFLLAAPMLPKEAPDAASRPGERFTGELKKDSWPQAGIPIGQMPEEDRRKDIVFPLLRHQANTF